jgi:uncharacterized protein (DUF885 family)
MERAMRHCLWIIVLLITIVACGCEPQDPSTADSDARNLPVATEADSGTDTVTEQDSAAKLARLFEEYWEGYLELHPTTATAVGDSRYNGLLHDYLGQDYRVRKEKFHRNYLEQIGRIDRALLTGQDRHSFDVFVHEQELSLRGMQFPDWLMPIDNQRNDIYGGMAGLGSGAGVQPFGTVKDYEDWFTRLAAIESLTDSAISNMREGLKQGYSKPRPVMENVVRLLDNLIRDDVEQTVFWKSIDAMPADIAEIDRERLSAVYRALLSDTVIPKMRQMREFVTREYLPRSRETLGQSNLPKGREWYAYLVEYYTSTNLPPEEIHAIGQREVTRILAEMRDVMTEVEFEGSLQGFFEYLRTDQRFVFESGDAAIDAFRAISDQVTPLLPRYFDVFPMSKLEIRAVDPALAETASIASYQAGSPDGERPGIFWVNTHYLEAQATYATETLYLHEAEPGHHFQSSIAQELRGVPDFRRFRRETAYDEGWGLYAEYMGREMGMFTDPYQYYGKLKDEQLRAMRLVVDTGLHHYDWTRDQAIEFMLENSPMQRSEAESEVDRYIAMPGQALAYKVGQRAIQEMRRYAEQQLGEHFDIKAFHRQILIDGPLPMGLLRVKVEQWVAEERSRLSRAT